MAGDGIFFVLLVMSNVSAYESKNVITESADNLKNGEVKTAAIALSTGAM